MGGMNFRDPYEFDPYGMEDAGGLLGRLLALQAEQSRYQPTPVNEGQSQSAPQNPNFRQVSRAPIATLPNSFGYAQPVLSDVSPDPVRPGSQYAQAPLALCATGPIGCAVGGGMTAGQILGGAAALLGGATVLNSRKKPPVSGKGGGRKIDGDDDEDEEMDADEMIKRYRAGVRARAATRHAQFSGDDPGDYCTNRYEREEARCYARSHEYPHWDLLEACKDHARERRRKCVKNGGRPDPTELSEWGPDHEEVYRNLSR